jgi:hypothetical protein
LPWLDKSTANPIEKARRVLKNLSYQNSVYYFDDGFPKPELKQQAANCLEVLDALASSAVVPAQEVRIGDHSQLTEEHVAAIAAAGEQNYGASAALTDMRRSALEYAITRLDGDGMGLYVAELQAILGAATSTNVAWALTYEQRNALEYAAAILESRGKTTDLPAIKSLLITSPFANVAQTFEQWASDPVRADKIPLAKHPNGAYVDTRSYLIYYGWISALKYGVPSANMAQGAEACQVDKLSSRVCERGTLSCDVEHSNAKPIQVNLAEEQVQKIVESRALWVQTALTGNARDEIRREALEDAANAALNASLDAIWNDGRLMDPREVGSACAAAIRSMIVARDCTDRNDYYEPRIAKTPLTKSRYQVLYEAGEKLLAAGHSEAYEVLYKLMKEEK